MLFVHCITTVVATSSAQPPTAIDRLTVSDFDFPDTGVWLYQSIDRDAVDMLCSEIGTL